MAGAVCLIFCKDGQEWSYYVKTELERLEMDIYLINFEEETPEPKAASLTYISQAPIVIIILSPEMINLLLDDERISFHALHPDPSKCIILLLGETKQTFEEVQISNRFPEFDQQKWTLLEYNDDWKSIELEITKLYDPVLDLQSSPDITETPSKLETAKAEKVPAARKKDKKSGKEKNEMTVIPSKGKCEERTEIVLAFKNEITQEKVEVFFENQLEHAEVIHIKEVTKLNPYTFKFTAPEHGPGKMYIKAMVKNESKSRQTMHLHCEASAEYEYFTNMDAVDGLNHILLYVCNETLEVLRGNRIETDMLDRKLAMGLFDYDKNSISTKGFELLFGQYEFCDTESSTEELPTLLHLAAKYGLKELVAKLTDLPGAAFANSITNSKKQQPAELASKNGHKDVEEMLTNFTDVDAMNYGVYVKMAGYGNTVDVPGYLRQLYYNIIAHTNKTDVQPVEYMDKYDFMALQGQGLKKSAEKAQPSSYSGAQDDGLQDEFYSSADDAIAGALEKPVRPPYRRFNTLPTNLDPVSENETTSSHLQRPQSTSQITHNAVVWDGSDDPHVKEEDVYEEGDFPVDTSKHRRDIPAQEAREEKRREDMTTDEMAISLMESFKNKRLNLHQVEEQFREFQSNSKHSAKPTKTNFNYKKDQIKTQKNILEKKGGGIFDRLFRGAKNDPKPKADSRTFTKDKGDIHGGNQFRDSSASSSSNESRESTASADSVYVYDGANTTVVARNEYVTNQTKRAQRVAVDHTYDRQSSDVSATALSLEKDMIGAPPPIPPKVPPRPGKRPAPRPRARRD